jgi:hypothetical protein
MNKLEMIMIPSEKEIVTPEPYFKIKFRCGNRQFYNVKQELYKIAEEVGIEIEDGYIEETCDYEGDLDKIRVYRERDEHGSFVDAILKYYEVDDKIPEDMDIVLSIF